MITGSSPKKDTNFRVSLSWFKLRIATKPGVQKYQLGEEEEESVRRVQFKPIASGFKIRTQMRVKTHNTVRYQYWCCIYPKGSHCRFT